MSSSKVFITGATGYIGGDIFAALEEAHPDWSYTCLVRNSDRGAQLAAKYPKVRLVYGGLDSNDLLVKESHEADIVIHCASADHEAGATAIINGLASKSTPGYLIHTSGTGILQYPDTNAQTYGEYRAKIWDDVADIDDIVNAIPDEAAHRHVDKIIFAGSDKPNINTTIVCPPTIYGIGRGPGNSRSIQVPGVARTMIERGKGHMILEGKNVWNYVHIKDLSKVYVALAESAANGGKGASWGRQGYYFAEAGEHVWGDTSAALAREAKKQGLVETDEVEGITPDEADAMHPYARYMWGANSRCRASRARKDFDWKPTEKSLPDSIAEAVAVEKELIESGAKVSKHV